jgi:phospholipid/cholesterol/gamma-HCH transport system substrate-binding protein
MKLRSIGFKIKLGLFILTGLALLVVAVFLIGKQQNLFNPVFRLTATFQNISGLQVGNNVRFSGINVGTVDNIKIINDSTVRVDMIIEKEVQQFVKADCEVSISSEGIIGDKLLIISHGSADAGEIKDGQELSAKEPLETDAILVNLKTTSDNVAILSNQLAEIAQRINKGNGILARLIRDTTIAENFNQTIVNLKKSSKGLDENIEAAKHNIFFKGYFNKKKRESEKKKKEEEQNKEEQKEK